MITRLAHRSGAFTQQPLRPHYSPLLIALTFLVCFSEGFGYFLREAYNVPSPHLLGIPLFFAALGVFYFRNPGFGIQKQFSASLHFILFATLWLFVQLAVRDEFYILGYGQTVLFIVMLFVTRLLFEQMLDRPEEERFLQNILGTALALHVIQIVSIVLVALAWHIGGVSLNLLEFLSQPVVSDQYGFRASGISREPAWAAIGLASTYLVIHYLAPERRTGALCGYILAAWLINSGTAYLFGILFGLMYMAGRRSSLMFIVGGIFALLAVALMTYLQWDRIGEILQGADPSMNMRFASTKVALEVVYESFPIGTGYGNFRLFGVYGAEFDNFINLDLIKRYKSDILLLNIISELGIAGVVFLGMFYRSIIVRTYIAPIVFLLGILFLFGTIIVPPLILVVATTGLLAAREKRQTATWLQQDMPLSETTRQQAGADV
tara:strand:+ start:61 stop:1368 length:1308 start_codon:yes stop_codon:yes gene_type:complete